MKKVLILIIALVLAGMAQAQTFKVLHEFAGGVDGSLPEGTLLRDAAGNLFGTTFAGGPASEGVVFKIDDSGAESVVFGFTFTVSGGFPASALVQDASGNLIGIADGGSGGAGVVYRVSQGGDQSILFHFQGGTGTQSKVPAGGILMDKTGRIFGTTLAGGKGNCLSGSGCGTVFRLDPNGTLRSLHDFNGGAGGSNPIGPLVQDASGNLYGVAQQGGNLTCAEFRQTGCGTVFKIAKDGKLTTLHTFKGGADGAAPQGGLLMDASGNLFGTTSRGGNAENGVVFKLTSNGTYTVLHRFTAKEGTTPNGNLAMDSTGNLFGTTQIGGGQGLGMVYELTFAGRLQVLHTFSGGLDGASPLAGVILDSVGNVYGTAVKNFLVQQRDGVVFEIVR